MVDDDEIGGAHPGAGALVETFSAVAVCAGARGGVGVDHVPDVRARWRAEIVAEAGVGGVGPRGDALEFVVVGIGKETRAVGEGVAEARGAEIIRFADEHGGLEIGVAREVRRGLEEPAAEWKVAGLKLLLQ